MQTKLTLSALTALGHETRLTVFRLLVQQGPAGLPAGEIALRLGVPAPTLSFHLKELERGQLVRSTRQQRQIIYAADYAGTRALLDFLRLNSRCLLRLVVPRPEARFWRHLARVRAPRSVASRDSAAGTASRRH
jgi:ArsR family transcriptional regulator, arsenate/arsenite/antimonite-responsive transcriptional repressor